MQIHIHHHHASFIIHLASFVPIIVISIIVKLFIISITFKLFILSSSLHHADHPCAGVPDVPARHHQRHPQQPAQADSPSGEVANTETDKQKDKYKYKFQTNTKTNLRQIQDNTFLNSHLKLTFQVER